MTDNVMVVSGEVTNFVLRFIMKIMLFSYDLKVNLFLNKLSHIIRKRKGPHISICS